MRERANSRDRRRSNRSATSSAPGVSDNGRDGGYNAGIAVFSYIIGGIIVWSLIGWGLDNLWGTRWIVLAGALLGAVGGFYLSHMHGLTSSRKTTGERHAASGPSEDGMTDAK
ncbi:Putative F0F1-ATPase subunit (ATPase_gene1) [Arthrobacter ulcerisalmonis]|uniref:F0F1-ATPase subunit (ATPase_gene1) n=1 Tax=Arthrobacter ulcerisalmonis TaxID=2483813 RepID=A0A3P5XEG1_9MICC|nr:AtpZ/AtpI family protein [Arthrobacter ulcerisalmonis]VDC25934.1 Putative F0F1-ATPase subunit (ATPase_gene1) [Arthrobacter ulcerisalmonis]